MAEGKAVIAAKLSAAQQDFPTIPKDGWNPHFKSHFATLGGIKAVVDPVLRAHKLAVVQAVRGGIVSTTLIDPESGEYLDSDVPLILTKDDPQAQGSAITYARRYGLSTLLGIVAEDDDDGEAASSPLPTNTSPGTSTTAGPTATPEGWFSEADCRVAHEAVVGRVNGLATEDIASVRRFRQEELSGEWPTTPENLEKLNALVSLLETDASRAKS